MFSHSSLFLCMTVLVIAGSVVGLSQEPHAFKLEKATGFSEQRSLVDIYLNC